MEALYQGNLGGLIGKKSMTEDLPPKLTSPEPTMVRADAPAQSTDGIPVSDFARQSVAQNDPLAWTSQSYALPADPFCPHCGGLILSHESACQSCKPVASTAVAGGTSQLLQDPFCPQCGGVILIGQTNCPACGALRAKVPLPGHLSTDFSSGTGIGFFRTNPARLHSSAPPFRETAWGRFFDPTVAEFQSIYAQVAKSPWIEQNRDHRAKISKMVFQYFSNIPDVGAHAEPVTVGPMRTGFLAGLAVAHRVIAAPSVLLAKRAIDVIGAAAGLILLAPLMAALALAVRLDSPGPALFRQARVGRGSAQRTEIFQMVKFRTMVADADRRSGAVWATENDPRITRVGRFLRATRLDELPQLWNVLKGDMSLIGPRPEQLGLFARLDAAAPYYAERVHGVRPGITGWAQVEVGYDATIDDVRRKILYDFAYALRLRSFRAWVAVDAWLLWRTAQAVVRREGH
jgi:lipopolysaccharide/colanic/teichoic acid biosynthesis glycosyltransferase